MEYLKQVLILWISLIIGLISGILSTRLFCRKDHTTSTDLELLLIVILKLTIIFVFFSIYINTFTIKEKHLIMFPFIFGMFTTQHFIKSNLQYLINKYIWKDKNPKLLNKYGIVENNKI